MPGHPYQGPPGFPPGFQRPPRTGTWKWVLLGGSLIVVVAAVAATAVFLLTRDRDETKIRALIGDFAAAIDTADQTKTAGYLCAEETQTYLDTTDRRTEGPQVVPSHRQQFTVSEVKVSGDVAAAVITFSPSATDDRLYFRKESGRWKVCAPAESQISPSS